ncbi:MAG: hypothetical protein ACOCYZ_04525 [Halococcoides sp.]
MAIGPRGLLVGAYLAIAAIVVLHQGSALLESVVSSARPVENVAGLIGATVVLAIGVALVAAVVALFSEHRWTRPLGVVASGAFAVLSALAVVVLVDPVLWVGAIGSGVPTLLSGVYLARYEPTPDARRRFRPGASADMRDGH